MPGMNGTTGGRFRSNRPNTEQVPRPQRAIAEIRPDGISWAITGAEQRELDHVVCCNPAKALCGAFVAGQDVKFGGPEKATRPCQECFNRAADGETCGEPDCPGGEE